MEVMVSITCLVFNHERYLRKTLEGFVNQKTNFNYEILIHDDASTDGSAAIIREYCEKYPDLIRPVFQTENQYSKKIRVSRTYLYPLVRGKYIASCEGDDYWCDENKLQRQVDYMEAHPGCSMCVHDTVLIDGEGNSLGQFINGSRADHDYRAKTIIKADGGGLFQTSSVMARRQILTERPALYDLPGSGDLSVAMYAGISGYVHYIGKVMSCYRVGHAGSWTQRTEKQIGALVRQREAEYEAFTRIDRETDYRYTVAFAVPRGLRLSTVYRKKYGLGKLLRNPKHLLLVVWTHLHTIPRKYRKKFLNWKNRGERILL